MSDEGGPVTYGPRFEAALLFSCRQHFGQQRKGSGAPYVTHPMAVASIVAQYGGDEEQAIAALLHDIVEDCGVAVDELEAKFGQRVAGIVSNCTDTAEAVKPPWRPRKEAHVAKVRGLTPDAKLVIAADKLHNALCIVRDRRRASVGETIWDRFSADREQVIWYYGAMRDALADGWQHELLDELGHTIAEFG